MQTGSDQCPQKSSRMAMLPARTFRIFKTDKHAGRNCCPRINDSTTNNPHFTSALISYRFSAADYSADALFILILCLIDCKWQILSFLKFRPEFQRTCEQKEIKEQNRKIVEELDDLAESLFAEGKHFILDSYPGNGRSGKRRCYPECAETQTSAGATKTL